MGKWKSHGVLEISMFPKIFFLSHLEMKANLQKYHTQWPMVLWVFMFSLHKWDPNFYPNRHKINTIHMLIYLLKLLIHFWHEDILMGITLA